jgi:hypothetical protein
MKNILKKRAARNPIPTLKLSGKRSRKEMSRRFDAAGGLLEPRVQGARSWRLDKLMIIEVRILKSGP